MKAVYCLKYRQVIVWNKDICDHPFVGDTTYRIYLRYRLAYKSVTPNTVFVRNTTYRICRWRHIPYLSVMPHTVFVGCKTYRICRWCHIPYLSVVPHTVFVGDATYRICRLYYIPYLSVMPHTVFVRDATYRITRQSSRKNLFRFYLFNLLCMINSTMKQYTFVSYLTISNWYTSGKYRWFVLVFVWKYYVLYTHKYCNHL